MTSSSSLGLDVYLLQYIFIRLNIRLKMPALYEYGLLFVYILNTDNFIVLVNYKLEFTMQTDGRYELLHISFG